MLNSDEWERFARRTILGSPRAQTLRHDNRLAEEVAEKLKFLSFRGAPRAEESLLSCV
jgi:hypothetical protein